MGQIQLFQKPTPIIDKQIIDNPIILVGHQSDILCLTVIKPNKLASSSKDCTIKIWSTVTNQCLTTLQGHKRAIHSIIELKDNRIASESDDYCIKLWCPKSFHCTATLHGHLDHILTLIQINNNLIASYAANYCIKVWNISTNKCIKTISEDIISSRIIALKDERLAYVPYKYGIVLCNTTTFQYPIVLKSEVRYCCQTCLVELKDNRLVFGNMDQFEVWNTLLGQRIYQMTNDTYKYTIEKRKEYMIVTRNEELLIAGDGLSVRLWNTNDYQCIKSIDSYDAYYPVELEDGRLAFIDRDYTIQLISDLI